MSMNSDRWIEMQPCGVDMLRIELTRCGHLWHGQAARLAAGRKWAERHPLATVIGGDFEVVRHQVITSAHQALKQ